VAREAVDNPGGEVLCRTQPRNELQHAEPEEDDAQADTKQAYAVAGHPSRDADVDRDERAGQPCDGKVQDGPVLGSPAPPPGTATGIRRPNLSRTSQP
jgi:hypothetical protein